MLKYRDSKWALVWAAGIAVVALWDILFLNRPALIKISVGFINTFTVAVIASLLTLILGWLFAAGGHSFEVKGHKSGRILLTFFINMFRSVPQIVGILFGYIGIVLLRSSGFAGPGLLVFLMQSLCISLFVFPEMADLMSERIAYFRSSDFYNAMRVCGIAERRIVNFHILWRNSRIHIFNKLISVFGMAVFLECSVDFIISVGLSNRISDVALPATLGSLLAKIDSKQDILAIGNTITNPLYFPQLVSKHLQGVTVAFLIVFTLMCIHNIAIGFARRNRL
jgi:ABC-type dipeptide/oligopeptide/nickel transport system permease subunit